MEFVENEKKKKKLKTGPICIVVSIICLIIGSVGGYFYGRMSNPLASKDLSVYDEVSLLIEDSFLDLAKSDYSMEERMLSGMVAALGDPHSSYMLSNQAIDMNVAINGQFVGIGVMFNATAYGGVILDVFPSSSAFKAGLLKGDVLTHVANTSVIGKSKDQIKQMIQGEKGTSVKIGILRNGEKKEMLVERGQVDSSVNTRVDGKLGYLQITTFGQNTVDLVKEALKRFKDVGVEAICIDLRGNGGGYLDSVKNLLDLFLPVKTPMFSLQDKKGNKKEYVSSDSEKYIFNKGFVLVDGGTASSSEVMCSALKEQLAYQVIGETTYGKGTAQTQATLSNSSTLKYTYAKWLTSKGEWVHEKGIEPDIKIDMVDFMDYRFDDLKNELKYDVVGVQVCELQRVLRLLGYNVDREDGYFSKATQDALMSFERDYHLKCDGVYTMGDAGILMSALSYYLYQKAPDLAYQRVKELMK